MAKIEPKLAAGFKDYSPREMIPRQRMLDSMKAVCELFGALPLDTSIVERYEVLTQGEPTNKEIFRIASRKKKKPNTEEELVNEDVDDQSGLALRFDLTVSLARFLAANPDVQKPFKRYQTGYVFRGENPQAGRFRGFTQFDLDTVGSSDPMSDAEIVAWMNTSMEKLGVPKFIIRVNSRKILNGLAEYAGFDASKISDVLRIIDKLDKQGWDVVRNELMSTEKKDETSEPGPGLSLSQAELIKKFIDLRGDSPRQVLDRVSSLMSDSKMAQEGVAELAAIAECIEALGVPGERWTIDLSIARGLDYYTGAIFETNVIGMEKFGSVLSGGRYDNLVARLGGPDMPAVGASVGVDRLFELLKELGLIQFEETVAQVAILNFEPSARIMVQQVASALRGAGINTELYMGKEETLKAQLSNVVSRNFRAIAIIGSRELERGVVALKDSVSRTQIEVPMAEVPDAVRNILGSAT